jgi:transmembrane sensor
MDNDLLNQYFQNSCTEDELNTIIEWFKHSAGTSEGRDILFRLLDRIPEDSGGKEDDRMDRILEIIHQRIDLKKSEKLIEQTGNEAVRASRRKHFIGILSKVAAAILIPVFLFGLYTSARYLSYSDEMIAASMTYYEVSSSADAITKVDLSDSTVVWLNHKSKLRYPARFEGDCRSVELTGEGYFDVAHNPDIPFVVRTGMMDVIARGTEFNVCAYPDDDKIETTLVEGMIEFEEAINRTKGQKVVSLRPSERLIYNRKDNEWISHMVEDDRYYAWKNGKLVFENETMEEVVKKLSRWFNVDIEIKDPALNDLTYTATFIDETLPQVMELLAIATPIKYSISNRVKSDDDTFSKRKVVMSARTRRSIK